jgi:hypothetical protein
LRLKPDLDGVLSGARSPAPAARLKRSKPIDRRAAYQGTAGQPVALRRLPFPQRVLEAGAIHANQEADILKRKRTFTGGAQQPLPSFRELARVGMLFGTEIGLEAVNRVDQNCESQFSQRFDLAAVGATGEKLGRKYVLILEKLFRCVVHDSTFPAGAWRTPAPCLMKQA